MVIFKAWQYRERTRILDDEMRAVASGSAILFFGDSIAAGFGHPAKLAAVNRGIGGQTTTDMLMRIDAELGAVRPKEIIIFGGANNLLRDPRDCAEIAATITAELRELAEHAVSAGARVHVSSVLPVPGRCAAEVARLNADLGVAFGVSYLDLSTIVAAPDGRYRTGLSDDGLHPNAEGYKRIIAAVERAIAQ